MAQNIYINYAHADQETVLPLIAHLSAEGLPIIYDNGSEQQISECLCVVHICSAASRTSRSYKRVMNFSMKHDVDCIQVHLTDGGIDSDLSKELDVMMGLFKYKWMVAAKLEAAVEAAAQKESTVQELSASSAQKPDAEVAADAETAERTEEAAQAETAERTEEAAQAETAERTEEAEKAETAERIETAAQPETAAHTEVYESSRTLEQTIDEMVEDSDYETASITKDILFTHGRRLLTGDGCEINEKAAFEAFRQAANQGHVEAQYQLCICYDRGIGVGRSITEAAKWCQMAAYGGHAQAQSEIGSCYEHGQGVVRNIKEAVRWYAAAAEQGNLEAMNNLAFCYQKGKGMPKNVVEAMRLYEDAAAAGHASAQYNLGFCYWYGEGVPTNKEKAIQLFAQSADNGNVKAAQMLKILNQHAYLRQ